MSELIYKKLLEVQDCMIQSYLKVLPKWVSHLYNKGWISDAFVLEKHKERVMDEIDKAVRE